MNQNMNNNMMNNTGFPQQPQGSQFNFAIPEDPMERGFIGACLAGVVGCFLPFYTVSVWGFTSKANLLDANLGVLVVIALIAAAALIFVKVKNYALISLGLVGYSLGYTLYQWYDIASADSMGIGSMSIGLWVILASLAGAGFCGFKIFQKEKGNAPVATPAFNNMNPGIPAQQPMVNQPMQQPMAPPMNQPVVPQQQQMMGQPPMGQPGMPSQQPMNDNPQNPNNMQ